MRRTWLIWLGAGGLAALLVLSITATLVIIGQISDTLPIFTLEEGIWAPAQQEREWLRLQSLLSQRALGAEIDAAAYGQQRDLALSRITITRDTFLPGSGRPVTDKEQVLIDTLVEQSTRFYQAVTAELPSPAEAQQQLPLVNKITSDTHDFLNLRRDANFSITKALLGLLSTLRTVELGTLSGLVLVGAVIAWLTQRSLRSNLRTAYETLQQRAEELERSEAQLTTASHLAEERNAALSQALADVQASAQTQAQLASTVEQLTLPIIPVMAGVLVMPVVGRLSTERWDAAMQRLLSLIVAEQCRMVVIDVTGVDDLGPVAARLQQTAQAVRLLGCTPVLVGISAGVAQALVAAGFDAATLPTYASLQQAIGWAVQHLPRRDRAR